ncbi:hypothetical protein FRC07_005680, partial [Ceratobasidium sp. 392]
GVASTAAGPGATTGAASTSTLVKHVLPRELQLYHDRLSAALVGGNERKRTAALSSLRADAGLQALLPYLIRWIGETVVRVLKGEGASHGGDDGSDDEAMFGSDELDRVKLDIMLDALKALLDNSTLFVEPYARARVSKTLILGVTAPGRQRGTREGALHGLAALGRVAAGRALVGARALKKLEGEIDVGNQMDESTEDLVQAATAVIKTLYPLPTPIPQVWGDSQPRPLEPATVEADRDLLDKLSEYFGQFFTMRVVIGAANAQWAHGLLESIESSKGEYSVDA